MHNPRIHIGSRIVVYGIGEHPVAENFARESSTAAGTNLHLPIAFVADWDFQIVASGCGVEIDVVCEAVFQVAVLKLDRDECAAVEHLAGVRRFGHIIELPVAGAVVAVFLVVVVVVVDIKPGGSVGGDVAHGALLLLNGDSKGSVNVISGFGDRYNIAAWNKRDENSVAVGITIVEDVLIIGIATFRTGIDGDGAAVATCRRGGNRIDDYGTIAVNPVDSGRVADLAVVA